MKRLALLILILAATRLSAELKRGDVIQARAPYQHYEENILINKPVDKMVDKLFLGKHDGLALDSGEHVLRRNWLVYTPHGPRYVSNPYEEWSVHHTYRPKNDQGVELLNHIWELHNREDLKPAVSRSNISMRVTGPSWGCNKRPYSLMNVVDPLRTKFCIGKAHPMEGGDSHYPEIFKLIW